MIPTTSQVRPARRAGGFPPEATAFFVGLEADNSRAYWTEHRAVFEAAVVAPMQVLLDSLPQRYGPFRLFRMHRDLRFSTDKSPYKTMYGAAHDVGGAVHYVHLDARGLVVVCGAYLMAPDQLDRYRRAVAHPAAGVALDAALDAAQAAGLVVDRGGAQPLSTAPRGYPRDHPRIGLLRQKGLIARTLLTADRLGDDVAVRDAVVEAFEAGAPLNDWIATHVGPTTRPSR